MKKIFWLIGVIMMTSCVDESKIDLPDFKHPNSQNEGEEDETIEVPVEEDPTFDPDIVVIPEEETVVEHKCNYKYIQDREEKLAIKLLGKEEYERIIKEKI